MCDVATAGVAISALGALYANREQAQYQKRTERAANDQALAELERQKGIQDSAASAFEGTVNKVGAQQGAAPETIAQSVEQIIGRQEHVPTFNAAAPVSGSANRVVADTIADRSAQEQRRVQDASAARARLSAYDDVFNKGSIALLEGADSLRLSQTASQGSLGLLPSAQQAAVTGVKRPSGLGDILSGAGQVGVAAGSRR